jgi:hypothetical protein
MSQPKTKVTLTSTTELCIGIGLCTEENENQHKIVHNYDVGKVCGNNSGYEYGFIDGLFNLEYNDAICIKDDVVKERERDILNDIENDIRNEFTDEVSCEQFKKGFIVGYQTSYNMGHHMGNESYIRNLKSGLPP